MKTTYVSPDTRTQWLHTAILCASGESLLPELNLSTDHHNSPKNSR
ncbi:MAG: hypothetical protein J6Y00_03735 [Paludibacteraceae bacterium]|nr:hypothetical protein [Paludibacteraceae bacterium]